MPAFHDPIYNPPLDKPGVNLQETPFEMTNVWKDGELIGVISGMTRVGLRPRAIFGTQKVECDTFDDCLQMILDNAK